jgi:bifunctional non-homologous end joining protein LigD
MATKRPTRAARASAANGAKELVKVDGHEVSVSNPGKVLFPEAGYTKLDLVRYYMVVADGTLRGAGGRPNMLVRYPDGVGGESSSTRSARPRRGPPGSRW